MKFKVGDRVILRENGCDCVVCKTIKEKNIVGTIKKLEDRRSVFDYCVEWDNRNRMFYIEENLRFYNDYNELMQIPDEMFEI